MIGSAQARLKHLAKQHVGPFVAARRPARVDVPFSRWDLSVTSAGTLAAGEHDLAALAAELGTPTHLVRGDQLDEACERAMGPARDGTGADIFYSYKTNPVPGVLRRIHERGIGAEVISAFELWLAIELGVPGDRIIYNGPAKSPASIRAAIEHGVLMINANTASEAELIARIAADVGTPVNLGLRVALPGTWGGQFGLNGIADVSAAVRRAIADPAVALSGLHVHRGITIRDAATMTAYVQTVTAFCAELAGDTGWHPAVVDLGGSLACATVAPFPRFEHRLNRAIGSDLLAPDPHEVLDIATASQLATRLVHEHADTLGVDRPRVVLEPGRSLTASTQLLLVSVVDVKPGNDFDHAVLDAGINIAEPVTSEYHQLFSVSAASAAPEVGYRLTGPICTPADVLYNHWRLPRLAPGHVLAIMDTGAYFVPFSTTFSFAKPAIALQHGGTIDVITRREEFSDIVARDGW